MFGRNKTQDETIPAQADHVAREGAKNRPTPKRREQEAARKRPLVVNDRKAARAADRAKRRQQIADERQAMLNGDERKLPVRDQGKVRRYIRDYVDARWGVGEFMLPVMLVVLGLSFVRQPWAMMVVFVTVYGVVTLAVVDTFFMWRRLKKRLVVSFGPTQVGGSDGRYAAMRAFQMRRTRMPRPLIKRGDYPS